MFEIQPSLRSANLTTLPEEIVERIIFFTTTECRLNLAVTSKFLCRLATSALYGDIEFTLEDAAEPGYGLVLLTRTLFQRPELAATIRNVNIVTRKDYYMVMLNRADRAETVTRNVEIELQLLHIIESNLRSSLGERIRSPLPQPQLTTDRWIELLLRLAVNIRTIKLGIGAVIYQSSVSRFIEQALTGQNTVHPFNSLSHIELPPDFTEGAEAFPSRSNPGLYPPIDYKTCLACFYGPAVQVISVSFPEPDSFSWLRLGEPPVAFKLHSLVLHHSVAKEETLRELLSVTPNLKKLRYDFWCEIDNPRGYSEYLTCSTLLQALDQVNCTLVQLVISVNFFTFATIDINEDGPYGLRGCIGSLSHFKQLEYLDMPLVVLLGWSPKTAPSLQNALPRTLRTLCLTDDMSPFESWEWSATDVVTQVRGALVNWKSDFPDLRSMNVRSEHWGQGWNTNLKPQIVSLGQEAGLRGDK